MINKIKYSFLKKKLSKPIYLIFFVTSKCNSKCRHCFYWKELKKKNRDLTIKEINNFSRQLGKLVWLSLSGGEPFLRKDIFDIYKIFVDNNKVESFSIPTNGILSDFIYSETKKMLDYGKTDLTINLSLEGPKEMHERIRGVKCYDRVMETYNKLKELKKKYPRFSIMVSTTLSSKNIPVIKEFHEEVKRKMPDIDFHNFEILRGNPKDKEYKTPDIKELEKIKPLLFKIWLSYDYYKSKFFSKVALNTKKELYELYLRILKEKKQLIPCYAGRVHCVIDYKGDIFFCELLPKIGNIRENSFDKIWNSIKAQKMRDFIDKKGCYCTHSCFQIINYIFNHKNWLKLLK